MYEKEFKNKENLNLCKNDDKEAKVNQENDNNNNGDIANFENIIENTENNVKEIESKNNNDKHKQGKEEKDENNNVSENVNVNQNVNENQNENDNDENNENYSENDNHSVNVKENNNDKENKKSKGKHKKKRKQRKSHKNKKGKNKNKNDNKNNESNDSDDSIVSEKQGVTNELIEKSHARIKTILRSILYCDGPLINPAVAVKSKSSTDIIIDDPSTNKSTTKPKKKTMVNLIKENNNENIDIEDITYGCELLLSYGILDAFTVKKINTCVIYLICFFNLQILLFFFSINKKYKNEEKWDASVFYVKKPFDDILAQVNNEFDLTTIEVLQYLEISNEKYEKSRLGKFGDHIIVKQDCRLPGKLAVKQINKNKNNQSLEKKWQELRKTRCETQTEAFSFYQSLLSEAKKSISSYRVLKPINLINPFQFNEKFVKQQLVHYQKKNSNFY